jgi:hypothetical protein
MRSSSLQPCQNEDGNIIKYTYDAADRLYSDHTKYYTYDGAGNMLSQQHTVTGGAGNWTRNYAITAGTNQTGSGTMPDESYVYDNRGNITSGFNHRLVEASRFRIRFIYEMTSVNFRFRKRDASGI